VTAVLKLSKKNATEEQWNKPSRRVSFAPAFASASKMVLSRFAAKNQSECAPKNATLNTDPILARVASVRKEVLALSLCKSNRSPSVERE